MKNEIGAMLISIALIVGANLSAKAQSVTLEQLGCRCATSTASSVGSYSTIPDNFASTCEYGYFNPTYSYSGGYKGIFISEYPSGQSATCMKLFSAKATDACTWKIGSLVSQEEVEIESDIYVFEDSVTAVTAVVPTSYGYRPVSGVSTSHLHCSMEEGSAEDTLRLDCGKTYYVLMVTNIRGGANCSDVISLFRSVGVEPLPLRVVVPADGYATLFYDSNLVVPEGVEVYGFSWVNSSLVEGTALTSGAILRAGEGYLVKAAMGSYDFVPTEASATAYESVLNGSMSEIDTPEGEVYAWGKPVGYNYGFYRYTGSKIKAGKAYFLIP